MLRGHHKRYHKLYLYSFDRKHPALHEIDDEDFIGCWEEDGLAIVFFHKPKDALLDRLAKELGLTIEDRAEVSYDEWSEGRKISCLKFGDIVLRPVWEEGPGLKFDPGVVFGSGNHPTTKLCLSWIYKLWQEYGPFEKVADLGCGAGLLSLLSASLGAQVLAVDFNPLCVELTRKNLALNHLEHRATVYCEDVKKLVPFEADLVIANLFKGLLLDLFGLPSFWQNRYYLFSGFSPAMEKELREALWPKARIKGREEENGWVIWFVENEV
ncbi:methyltransferase small [Thermodesulfatator indicus DSM 15286]|uniref:Methyltransferase small n=1 Tax=Thermodesulfatator indicus (strain DSM 15286 / JCM 11887 / CIR29812) TaxID=667014 RepID=F8ABE4_THEID|nr:50S ribosomal protein L11 methyltransferase [Thermodesulfatator indicus]AEH44454.1 methyltransferase small [Thermodesulfatator indicus DSM 15286]